jgi:hypothetical protein
MINSIAKVCQKCSSRGDAEKKENFGETAIRIFLRASVPLW